MPSCMVSYEFGFLNQHCLNFVWFLVEVKAQTIEGHPVNTYDPLFNPETARIEFTKQ